jgi:NADH-quinone oxidoreductase subunit N
MWHDLFLISPLLIVTVLGLVALLAATFAPKDAFKGWVGYVTTFGMAIALVFAIALYSEPADALKFNSHAFGYALVLDHFGLGLSIVILLGAALMSLAAVHYLAEQKVDHGEFHGLVAFASVGMMALVMANDLLTFFIALELMSLSVYVLAGFKRQSKFSTESAMKYFVLGSFASGLLLLGIAFVYGATGDLSLNGIAAAMSNHALENTPELVRFALVLLIAAFFFKVAAAPFHMWTPDVYEGAPSTATGFMAIAVKTAAFGAFARLLLTAFGAPELRNEGLSWELLIVIGAVASMTLGNLMALGQKNLKRMLAYSAIAHTGYLMLALLVIPRDGSGVASLGAGFLFYLLAYTLANATAFGVAAAVSGNDREDLGESAYAGLAKRSPGLAFALTIAMLSLLGIPLTAGFMGKLTVFEELLTARSGDYLWLVIVAVVNSVISAWYYLRVIMVAYMREESTETPITLFTSRPLAFSLGLASILTLIIGVLPTKALVFSKTAGTSMTVRTVDTASAPDAPAPKTAAVPER